MKPSIPHESLGEELRHNLQIGIGAALIGGALLGFLTAAATLALNPALLRSAGDVLRILLGLQFVYALLCLALGLAGASIKTAIFLGTGRQLSDTKTAAFLAGVGFFLLGALYGYSWCRWHEIGGLDPGARLQLRHLPVLLAILAASAILGRLMSNAFYILIVYVKKPEKRRPGDLRRAFFVLLYMGVVFALSVAVMRVTAKNPAAESGLTRDAVHATGRQVLLLGIDGMSGDDMRRLRQEGHLAWSDQALSGTRAVITLPEKVEPPILWTEIASGRDLIAHGVIDYQAHVVKGLKSTLRMAPNQIGVFELFNTVLPFLHLTRTVPFKSYMRESKGLWNMATDARLRSVAVNWWVSWPAERVRGAVVSDHAWLKLSEPSSAAPVTAARAAAEVLTPEGSMIGATCPLRSDGRPLLLERETWPPALLVRLSALAVDQPVDSLQQAYGAAPSDSDRAAFEKLGIPFDVVRSDLFYAQAAAGLRRTESPDLWMLHLPGPDIIRRVLRHRVADLRERETARRSALRLYWKILDPALAACLRDRSLAPEHPLREQFILTLWLPGELWPEEGAAREAGLFGLAGGDNRAVLLGAPVRVTEIAPTILWLLGLPASREMDGEPRLDAVPTVDSQAFPVRWISSYGRQETDDLEQAAGTLDQEMLERFRSLGYIR